MKKVIIIAVSAGLIVSINGCGKIDNDSDSITPYFSTSDTAEPEVIDEEDYFKTEIVTILNENKDYLNKYVKTSSNENIILFGLDEEFETIKDKSVEAEEETTRCIDSIALQSDYEFMKKFYSEIIVINERFEEENDKMKEAKKTLDIDSLENIVEELSGILDNYIEILKQVSGGA